jgi:hypothetical protein
VLPHSVIDRLKALRRAGDVIRVARGMREIAARAPVSWIIKRSTRGETL